MPTAKERQKKWRGRRNDRYIYFFRGRAEDSSVNLNLFRSLFLVLLPVSLVLLFAHCVDKMGATFLIGAANTSSFVLQGGSIY